MVARAGPKVTSRERRLHREAVQNTKVFPVAHARRRLFGPLDLKVRVSIAEKVASAVVQYVRKYAFLVPQLRILPVSVVAPVHENILLDGVPVKIHAHDHRAVFAEAFEHVARLMDGRVPLRVGTVVIPVQIDPLKRAPVVTMNHPIWVEHRHYFKDDFVSERLCLGRVSEQKVQQSAHHPGCVALSWVNARRDKHSLAPLDLGLARSVVGHCEEIASVLCKRVAQQAAAHVLGPHGIVLDPVNIVLEVRIRVRVAVRKEDGIKLSLHVNGKCEGVVWLV